MRAVLLFFIVLLVVFAVVRGNAQDPRNLVENEAALNWTLRAVGSLVAAVAAFALLLRGMASESLERQFGLALPLLGGMFLVNAHWAIALALGAVGVALISRDGFAKPVFPPREDSRPTV